MGGVAVKDPRDTVGDNPTGRPRKASAGQRRKVARKLERDLNDSPYEKPKKD
jgi:hypothetical protein